MRLTADVILRASSRFNPLNQRELELRGLKIPAIENLAVTQDQFDAIDFSDNELRKIDNLPKLVRLVNLIVNNNSVRIISSDIGEKCPNLETLVLTNNRISNLAQIDSLAGCRRLLHLSLIGNPVVHQDNYRLYVIHKIPSLRSLDFRKVSRQERLASEKLFASKEGRDMKKNVAEEAKTFSVEDRTQANGELTEDQKRQIREAIANANSPAEVDRIERQLRAGTFQFAPAQSQQKAPAAAGQQEEERKEEVVPASPVKRQAPTPAPAPAPAPAAVTTPKGRARRNSQDNAETPMQTDDEPAQKQKRSRTDSVSSNKGSDRRKSVDETAAPNAALTPQSAKKMKVAELKSELQARGLPTNGLKADLLERLLGHLEA